MDKRKIITIETQVNSPVSKVWQFWNNPERITQWYSASPDWHTPRATNNLTPGGSFSFFMEAKDGSQGFDLAGTYDEIIPEEKISYTLADDRKATVLFTDKKEFTHIEETFDTEELHSAEMQKAGWQAILDNFKQYTETN